MDKKDFRIGNIIRGSQYIDTDEAKEDLKEDYSIENEWDFLQVESVEHENSDVDFFLKSIRNNSIPFSETWSRIEPVKITESLLLGIGFEKYPHGGNGFMLNGFAVYILSSCIEVEHTPGKFTDRVHVCSHIKYFHELQNLYYALLGIELEVDSFFIR